jgi:hypothetical protein
MDQQIRSADLLLKTALSSPQTIQELKTNTEETLTKLSVQAVDQLPRLEPPSPPANDRIWLLIVGAFALVMIGSAAVLGAGVFSQVVDASKQITKSDTILTVFTTVVGFLAGLLAPSPVSKKNTNSA